MKIKLVLMILGVISFALYAIDARLYLDQLQVYITYPIDTSVISDAAGIIEKEISFELKNDDILSYDFDWRKNVYLQYMRSTYAKQMSLPIEQRKYVLFKALSDGIGFGNQMDAIILAFKFSIALERIFIIDYPLFLIFFAPTDMVDWRIDTHLLNMNLSDFVNINMMHIHVSLARRAIESWNNVLHNKSIIVFHARDNHRTYKSTVGVKAISNFFHKNETMKSYSLLLHYLCQTKTERFALAMKDAKIKMGFPKVTQNLIAIQYRAFVDNNLDENKSINRIYITEIWNCMISKLQLLPADNKKILFLTSDKMSLFDEIKSNLTSYGTVLSNTQEFHHTATTTAATTAIESAIIDWYIIGEANVVFCTLTTYCKTAFQRNQLQPKVFSISPDLEGTGIELCSDYDVTDWRG